MSWITLFGLLAVTLMLITYELESKHHIFVLLFSGSCLLVSAYGFLQGAWPISLIEVVFALSAFRRWYRIDQEKKK